MKIFCHLQSNKPCTNYDRFFGGMLSCITLDIIGISNIAKRKYSFQLNARKRGTKWFGTRRQNQFVIIFHIFPSRIQVSYRNLLLVCINRQNFIPNPNINIKTAIKTCSRLYKKFIPFLNHITNIIGQSAVCIRNVFASFKHDNLCFLIHSSQSCSCTCTACNGSYYNIFHDYLFI